MAKKRTKIEVERNGESAKIKSVFVDSGKTERILVTLDGEGLEDQIAGALNYLKEAREN